MKQEEVKSLILNRFEEILSYGRTTMGTRDQSGIEYRNQLVDVA